MKKLTFAGLVFLAVLSASLCLAGSEIPNLVGAWEVRSEGGVIIRGDKTGKIIHWEAKQTSLKADIEITKQDGRVLFGIFRSSRATEQFIAVIGHDNKTLYYVDEDGFVDGRIINKDKIEVVYRHVTPTDTVAAVGVYTRKK
jgi:hypothetical protein